MNNTFNINRFGLLLRRQWLEFGKIFLITLAVAFGVIAAFYLVALWGIFKHDYTARVHLDFREPLFLIFGFLFISVIASNYFAHLGQKSKTVIDLLIPASTFEKFLAGVFFTLILSLLSFVVIFYLADLAFISKLRDTYSSTVRTTTYTDALGRQIVETDSYAYFFTVSRSGMLAPFYVAPMLVTAAFLLGSIYFNKFHYIKTAIALMLFSGLWTYLFINTTQYLMEGRRSISGDGHSGWYSPSKNTAEWLLVLGVITLALIFWIITYVRLKEKQV